MAKAEEQKKDLAAYLQAGCKPEGKLAVGLAVEHFITHAGGEPVTFTQVQNVMRQMQAAGDMPILQDGQYLGFTTKQYGVTLESACQMEIRIAPQLDMIHLVDIYNAFYLQLSMTLATHGLRAWTVSYHPTRRAEELPLVPTPRNEAMDRYFRQTGACGVQMMRATASTQLIIDYYSERDFVQKMRAACLLTPFFGLLSDNAPIYQGNRNNACSVRTRIWQEQHKKAYKLLADNRRKLDEIAQYLYEKETISGEEFMRILNAQPQLPAATPADSTNNSL